MYEIKVDVKFYDYNLLIHPYYELESFYKLTSFDIYNQKDILKFDKDKLFKICEFLIKYVNNYKCVIKMKALQPNYQHIMCYNINGIYHLLQKIFWNYFDINEDDNI